MGDLVASTYFTSRTPPSVGTSSVGPPADLEAWLATLTIEPAILAAASGVPWIDITVSPYNADNTGLVDASAAVSAALDAGIAFPESGFAVLFPPGTYLLSSAVVKTALVKGIQFVGLGVGITKILIDNATGGISLTFTSRDLSFECSGVGWIAGRAAVPYGLEVIYPSIANATSYIQACIRDCVFIPEVTTVDYFTRPLSLTFAQNSLIENVVINARVVPVSTEMLTGIRLLGVSKVTVRDCTVIGAAVGLSGAPSGATDCRRIHIDGGVYTANWTGISLTGSENPAIPDDFTITSVRLQCNDRCIVLLDIVTCYISNVTFEPSATVSAAGNLYYDLEMTDCVQSIISSSNCRTLGSGFGGAVTATFLKASNIDNVTLSNNILANRNTYYDIGVGSTAVKIHGNNEGATVGGAAMLVDSTGATSNAISYSAPLEAIITAYTDDATPSVANKSVIKVGSGSTLSITTLDFAGGIDTPGHVVTVWVSSTGVTFVHAANSFELPHDQDVLTNTGDRLTFVRVRNNSSGALLWLCTSISEDETPDQSTAVSANVITLTSLRNFIIVTGNDVTINQILVQNNNFKSGRIVTLRFSGTGTHTLTHAASNIYFNSAVNQTFTQNQMVTLTLNSSYEWLSDL